ncbi:MAG: ABC transporter substrate-binding protein [Propionicimonas sp.]|nr:ABC transporter substrate-binding protein [Propionicimonas sp.]
MARIFSRAAAVAALAAITMGLAACSSGSPAAPGGESTSGSSPDASATTAAASEAPASSAPDATELTTTPGTLTIATGNPAYSPWVEDDKPESKQGFEAAVAYAVAEKLGFADADVSWVRTTFDEAIAPGPKAWDLNIQQFSITEEREKAVDFSSGYYTTAQAVLTYEGSPLAGATTLAQLKQGKLGAMVGTTSLNALNEQIAPATPASVFNSNADTAQALKNKQVDAIVVDLPTALYLAAVEIDGGKIIGQLADASGGDQFGFVLPKGSKLTAPVSAAVDALAADGTLAALEKQWLSESISVPVLS